MRALLWLSVFMTIASSGVAQPSLTYGGGAARSQPVISDLRLKPDRFRIETGYDDFHHRPIGGSDVSFELGEATSVQLGVEPALATTAACPFDSGPTEEDPRCPPRPQPAKPLGTIIGHKGLNTFRFSGKRHGTALAAGLYELFAISRHGVARAFFRILNPTPPARR